MCSPSIGIAKKREAKEAASKQSKRGRSIQAAAIAPAAPSNTRYSSLNRYKTDGGYLLHVAGVVGGVAIDAVIRQRADLPLLHGLDC
jgi:hypothetical protein